MTINRALRLITPPKPQPLRQINPIHALSQAASPMPDKPNRYHTYTYDTKGNLIGIDEAVADARDIVATSATRTAN